LDICGTLAPVDSWLALTRDMGGSVERHLEIFHTYRDGQITYEESRVQLIGLWRATGHANRADMTEIFRSWPLEVAAAPLVDDLRARGWQPVIITGAVDLYAQVVAERLGVSDWYANTALEFDADGQLVTYHYILDQSAEKVRQLAEFCQRRGLEAGAALAIGDGPNDLGLFQATGRGILLDTPQGTDALKAAAWRTVARLGDVTPLLAEA